MTDISIYTFTLGGRPKYLWDCAESVFEDMAFNKLRYNHHIICQGPSLSAKDKEGLESLECIVHEWPENIGIGAGINKIMPELDGALLFKMDDDCKIISQDFFTQAWTLHKKFPNECFNPYPVGLTGHPGGPRGFKHSVWHDPKTDTVYTRRHVNHLGGFSRFTPASIIKGFTFPNDLISGISGSEDGSFSKYCQSNNIPMFYLENALVVEHAESTVGQVVRYYDYFKDRQYESALSKTEVIE